MPICSKCQSASSYDEKEFFGLCPACWVALPLTSQYDLRKLDWAKCHDCGCLAESKNDFRFGYCEKCYVSLRDFTRAKLKDIPYKICVWGDCTWTETEGGHKLINGYCQYHWTRLTPQERAILNGQEPPPETITKVVTVQIPAQTRKWVYAGLAFIFSVIGTISALILYNYFFNSH